MIQENIQIISEEKIMPYFKFITMFLNYRMWKQSR